MSNSHHKFRPLPFLKNRHIQTFLGAFVDNSPFEFPSLDVILKLPDGDSLFLVVSEPENWQPPQPTVVLVHGLTGSHRSGMMVRVGKRLYEKGWRVIRMNQRSAGAGLPYAKKPYHAGRSDDVRAVLENFQVPGKDCPTFIVGFSLGGNLVLKLAGEQPNLEGLAGVAAMGPPIDLAKCSDLIGRKSNQVYEKHFLSNLLQDVKRRLRYYPGMPNINFPKDLSIRLFDELYTAPSAGYGSVNEYYSKCSTTHLIDQIKVPTLILTAKDDPFIAPEPFESLKVPEHIQLCIQESGGHLGFLGKDGAGGIRWGESRIISWLADMSQKKTSYRKALGPA
ncbi:MAG: YheT family hydrolase [Planctomycetia bacterium]